MAMPDRFSHLRTTIDSPLRSSEVADHSASDHEFANTTRSILVTGDGNLAVRLVDDNADLTLAVTAGTFLPLRVTHVRRASTAACVGFW